jgi:nucleoside-diphosphate-sugar epimerase
MAQKVLILGATGRFGRHAVDAFEKAGWIVQTYDRNSDDLMDAAQGADVIVNAWNPSYPDWQTLVPGLTAQVIQVASAHGATVIIPGNVYVFGSDTLGCWSATTPHKARNVLGRVRIEMEAAYRRSGVRTIVLRSGDFIDTQASGNWFDMIMTKSLAKGVFTYPGNPEMPHSWAYLPDVCRASVQLAEMRDQLPVFSDIPFPGYTLSGVEMRAALQRVVSLSVRLKQMSWLPIRLAQPFWRMAGSLLEMRYLWNRPHWLDHKLFEGLLPDFNVTVLDDALKSTLTSASVQHKIDPDHAMSARL